MTFEDMMQMKRLGETAVSPDGKWLAYSVTTVESGPEHQNGGVVAAGDRRWRPDRSWPSAQPGDSGVQFAPDGKRILFLSSREAVRSRFGSRISTPPPAHTNQREEADATFRPRPTTPSGRPTASPSSLLPPSIRIARQSRRPTVRTGDKCNADRDAAAAASKVKAQIFTHLLYRHWDHFTGDKRSHLFLASVETGAVRDLTPQRPARRSAVLARRRRRLRHLRPTPRNWPSRRTSIPSRPSPPSATSLLST